MAQCHWFYSTLQGTAWSPHFGQFYRLQTHVSSHCSTDVAEKLPHKHGAKRKFLYKFPFNNQIYALIIQIYSAIKLYMFRASSLSIIRSSLLYIRHW